MRDDADADAPEQTQQDRDLHAVCEDWAHWRHSRRLYAPASQPPSLLGRLTAKQRGPARPGGPDAVCSAEMHAFHVAYLCQPDGLPKTIFTLHYWHRVKPIKAAASALGISRAQWYVLLSDIRRGIYAQSQRVAAENSELLGAMRRARLDAAVPHEPAA